MKAEKNINEERLAKAIERETKKADRKSEYLLKLSESNPFMKLIIYAKHNFINLILLFFTCVLMFGVVLGVLARIIFEIWQIIFNLSL